MRGFVSFLFLPLPACLLGGDGGGVACTEMGCEDGLSIQFSVAQPGAYAFEIVADGRSFTCNATLPLPPCGSAAPTCSDARVAVGESGCALPQADQSLTGLSLFGLHPENVTVTVHRDGTEIASQSFAPGYQRLAPNGEACGPVCHHATVTLVVSDPP